jgi:hypothetical protein
MQNPNVLTPQRDSKNDAIFGLRPEMQRRIPPRAELNTTTIRTHLVRILPPLLQNSMFSLEKPGFEDDSGDSLARLTEMFLGSKVAHKTMISTGAAPAGMDMHG